MIKLCFIADLKSLMLCCGICLRPTACVITVKKTQAQQQLQQQQQQQQHTAPTNASLTILRSCLSHVKPITCALSQTLQT